MKKLLILASAAFLSAVSITVQAYQIEAGVGYSIADFGTVDYSALGVGGQYYFEDVDVGSSPLGEADFLGKSSDVRLFYQTGAYEQSGSSDLDTTALSFGIEYFLVDNVYVGVDLNSLDVDNAFDLEISSTDLRGGFYVDDATSIGLLLSQGEWKDNTGSIDTSGMGLRVKTLVDDTYSLYAGYETETLEATKDLDTTTFNIGGMYYPNQTTGIGIEFSSEDDEVSADESTSIEVNGQVFLNDDSYIEAAYSTTSYDVDPDDTKWFIITYAMRF